MSGMQANIFNIAFSATNKYVFSCVHSLRDPCVRISPPLDSSFTFTIHAQRSKLIHPHRGGADDRIMQYDFATATELMARSATSPTVHADARYLEHDVRLRLLIVYGMLMQL